MVNPVSSSGSLVVAHPERKAQRALHRLVGATLAPVRVVADAEALCATVDASTIAVVDAAIACAHPELLRIPALAWIAVAGEGATPLDPETVTALLAAGWCHVMAHPMPLLGEELLATVQKLLRGEIFGLEKYMAWGAEVRDFTLANARDRERAVATLAADIVAIGLPDRISSLVSVTADELIANAVYAAPVDASGARFRAQEPRDAARSLLGLDIVTVRWATDARYLAIEVRDHWGSLDIATIAARLAAGANQAATAATPAAGGMGLPLAYACCTQLVVGSTPTVMTEIIALLDVRHKPTELCRAASFHTFAVTATP